MANWNPLANELFLKAVEINSPADLDEFLTQECGSDAKLREEVKKLLESHLQAGSLLEHPAIEGLGTKLFSGEQPPGGVTDTRTVLQLGDTSLDFLQASDDPKSLGRLGQYEILEVIGRGGWGLS